MAVLKNKDGTELLVDCHCTCGEGMRIKIDKDDFDYYFMVSYVNGNFYRDQDDTLWRVFCKKLKKIWCIVKNKDYYYSDICMTKKEFCEFKDYINNIG